MDGIVVIDKPQGMTSHDVVSFLRRKTGVRRIGHSGTLDPMATGVLPVFIGKATRLIEYAGAPGSPEAKLYRCDIKFGLETDTQDIWGARIEGRDGGSLPRGPEIERALKSFEGPGLQRPPMYSAVKVGGRKLYDYARKGDAIDESLVKEREIYIKRIEVKQVDEAAGEAAFEALCSKGVYIRALCADAGRLLGCGAVMSGLRRLSSDGFSIGDAVPLDDLRGEGAPMPPLLPMDGPLAWMRRVDLSESGSRAFAQGRTVAEEDRNPGRGEATPEEASHPGRGEATRGLVRVYGPGGFLGVGSAPEGAPSRIDAIKPVKVLV